MKVKQTVANPFSSHADGVWPPVAYKYCIITFNVSTRPRIEVVYTYAFAAAERLNYRLNSENSGHQLFRPRICLLEIDHLSARSVRKNCGWFNEDGQLWRGNEEA